MKRPLVVAVLRGRCLVRHGDETISCRVRGNLIKGKAGSTCPVCVGDEVELVKSGGEGVIQRIYPRRTKLSRRVNNHVEQVIAANVDQAVIVVAAAHPPARTGTIERYLISATAGGLSPLLCVNKIDLDERAARAVAARYQDQLGVILTSTVTGAGLAQLRLALASRISVFTGPSGVGKSSLLNALEPGLDLASGEVTDYGKGRHTTTGSWLVELSTGGLVVDTPGHRAIDLWYQEGPSGSTFPEIADIGTGCRFRNCSHTHEPGCAVKEAVQNGEVDVERYRQYVKLAGFQPVF
ncbi:MAG: ribosome small subunit-dependent GTPase A [Bacillota bacterium]